MRKLVATWFAVAFVAVLVATGCGSDSDPTSHPSISTTTTATVAGAITVSAAASLTEAFTEIGADFEHANPEATATFNFGSSGTLATQIEQGAPADGFASADEANMDTLMTAGLVAGEPEVFARNRLVIVTKPGNPDHVQNLSDLADMDVVSLCGLAVPCGTYADQVLTTAGVTIPAGRITRGQDVKTTLGAVTTGDADAAIVYATDAKSAGDAVEAVTIPDAQNVVATYPIAVLAAGANQAVARAFVVYVSRPKGQATLRSFGFLPPS
jgi:molybdate transport system substrate-binding protein